MSDAPLNTRVSRTPPVDQDEVERAAKAIETEIEEQTGGAWPIKVGDDLHLVDAELDLRAIARAALKSTDTGGQSNAAR